MRVACWALLTYQATERLPELLIIRPLDLFAHFEKENNPLSERRSASHFLFYYNEEAQAIQLKMKNDLFQTQKGLMKRQKMGKDKERNLRHKKIKGSGSATPKNGDAELKNQWILTTDRRIFLDAVEQLNCILSRCNCIVEITL